MEPVPPLVIIRNCHSNEGLEYPYPDLVIHPPDDRAAAVNARALVSGSTKIISSACLSKHGHPYELWRKIEDLTSAACFHTPSLRELAELNGVDNSADLLKFGLQTASELVRLMKEAGAEKVLILSPTNLTCIIELGFLGGDFLLSDESSAPWENNGRREIYIGNGWGANHNDRY